MHYTHAKTILTNGSTLNIYRGCTHGCIYCDSRSLCYRFTHPFEDIEVKINAPALLDDTLRKKRKKIMISTGSMSDPYQPCEAQLMLTRQCLETIYRHGFGASVLTKSDMVLRDIGLLEEINKRTKAVLQITLTCADDALSRLTEPNVCPTSRRYEVLKEFQKRHIPAVVWMNPLLPFLTDDEENFDKIIEYCLDSGVKGIICFNIGMTLRDGDREYYYAALNRHFPGLSKKYADKYKNAYDIESDNSVRLMKKFHETCEKYGILHTPHDCFAYIKKLPENDGQLSFI